MHYIIVTEFETIGETTCKVKGLSKEESNNLAIYYSEQHISCNKMDKFFEVDISGDQLLKILARNSYNYRVVSQSMAIENTTIGGRTVWVQKLIWTMGKQ